MREKEKEREREREREKETRCSVIKKITSNYDRRSYCWRETHWIF